MEAVQVVYSPQGEKETLAIGRTVVLPLAMQGPDVEASVMTVHPFPFLERSYVLPQVLLWRISAAKGSWERDVNVLVRLEA